MRKANSRNPEVIRGPGGPTRGYKIDLGSISVAEENIFYNYDDSEPSDITFTLSNRNKLILYFPEQESCYLIPDPAGRAISSAAMFRTQYDCPIKFVPILGPVEHRERLNEEETARRALLNYRASRNFRNIWHHMPEKFGDFQTALEQTWPGMKINAPEINNTFEKPILEMFCEENRRAREIFWAGFGFQVWCQMLTHVIQANESSIFLIDEPDIYLHSDLQRQLLSMLRSLESDVLLATHSTEMIVDAETDDIVVINKTKTNAKRIKNPSELGAVFEALGSNLNPILSQVAKTRRVLFVEGTDFQVISRFAKRIGMDRVASRADFAVIAMDGFDPKRAKAIKEGIEATLGTSVRTAIILDGDFRSEKEKESIQLECLAYSDVCQIHDCKEIENFLLIPSAIDRAIEKRIQDRLSRGGKSAPFVAVSEQLIAEFCQLKRAYILSQSQLMRKNFERQSGNKENETVINEAAINEFETAWQEPAGRMRLVPGKDAISFINAKLQAQFNVSVTATAIIDGMTLPEVPVTMKTLLDVLEGFSKLHADV